MLEFIDPFPNVQAYFGLLVVLGMFVLFLRETFPTEVVALGGAVVMLVTGILPYETALTVFSNPAPWTIAMMFIVMGGLVRTGALGAFVSFAEAKSKGQPLLAIAVLLAFVAISSAFVSNTPVVVVMIPVFVQLARSMNMAASKAC